MGQSNSRPSPPPSSPPSSLLWDPFRLVRHPNFHENTCASRPRQIENSQGTVKANCISDTDTIILLTDVKTVKDVKEKLSKKIGELSVVDIDEGFIHKDDDNLSQIQRPIQLMKRNTARKLNLEKNLMDGDDAESSIVAEDVFGFDDDNIVKMECKHYASPIGIIGYIEHELCDKKATTIRCPFPDCKKLWSMKQIRHKADLSEDEFIFFEAVLTRNNICRNEKCLVIRCPNCDIFGTRKDENDSILHCSNCKTEFCFKCGCVYVSGHTCVDLSELQEILKTATLKDIGNNIGVPSTRLCPNRSCRATIEHISDCKQMICPRCKTDFCFVCLRINDNAQLTCSGYLEECQTHPIQRI